MLTILISLVYLLALGLAAIASENVVIILLFVSAGILLANVYLTREEESEPIEPVGQALMQRRDQSDLADAVASNYDQSIEARRRFIAAYVMPPHPHCPQCGFSGYDPSRPCNACRYREKNE